MPPRKQAVKPAKKKAAPKPVTEQSVEERLMKSSTPLAEYRHGKSRWIMGYVETPHGRVDMYGTDEHLTLRKLKPGTKQMVTKRIEPGTLSLGVARRHATAFGKKGE